MPATLSPLTIEAALYNADTENLFGMRPQALPPLAKAPARSPRGPSPDFVILGAVCAILVAAYATIIRCTSNYASVRCNPQIEVCVK